MNASLAVVTSALVFMLMDATYIYSIKDQYLSMIQHIQGGGKVEYNVYAILLCYVFLICGLIFYVIPYAQKLMVPRSVYLKSKVYTAMVAGGVFGAIVYGVLCTTNVSLFKDFNVWIAVMDTIWGAILYTSATLVYLLLISTSM